MLVGHWLSSRTVNAMVSIKRLRAMPRVVVLSICLVNLLYTHSTQAQFAKQVLQAGLYNKPFNGTIDSTAAVSTQESVQAQFIQPGVVLPKCPSSKILQTALGIPENWSELAPTEQATHPANALVIQLAYAAWRDDPDSLSSCLAAMGISSTQAINAKVEPYKGTMTAVVMRAGSKAVFVSFRGTDFEDPGDVLVDADCAYTPNLRRYFTQTDTGNIRLHNGFYRGWLALERDVTAAVNRELQRVDSNKRVYIIGHSLGGALAAIAALRLNHRWQSTTSPNQIAGVWLYGCPRIGNAGWQAEYNRNLLSRTLRMSNYADFASRLPMLQQICPLNTLNGTFSFNHIGRSLVLCPNLLNGLVNGVLEPRGSERLDCGILDDVPDLSVRTHWLGAYLDQWRRHYTQATGRSLQVDERMANVVCAECVSNTLDTARQLNTPARAGGPVACVVSSSCNNRQAWDATTLVGNRNTKSYSFLSTCLGYICT